MNLLPVTIVILNICLVVCVIALTVFAVGALSYVMRDVFDVFRKEQKNDDIK